MQIRNWYQIILVVLILAFPLLFANSAYLLDMAILIGIYFIVCAGLSLIFGYTGQLSLAQAAFYGIGAYTSAILTTKLGLPVWVGFLAAMIIAGSVAYVISFPIFRLQHFYLAMATLAFGDIVLVLFVQWVDLTGGPTGITNIPFPSIGGFVFSSPFSYYYLVWIVAIAVFFFCRNIIASQIGRVLRAISASESGAVACGVDVTRYKAYMFALGGVLAGIAGALRVHYIGFISPDSFTADFSVLLVIMLAVGGMNTLGGAVLGAIFAAVIPNLLADFERYSQLIYGTVFVICVMLLPQGLFGILSRLWTRFNARFG